MTNRSELTLYLVNKIFTYFTYDQYMWIGRLLAHFPNNDMVQVPVCSTCVALTITVLKKTDQVGNFTCDAKIPKVKLLI